MFADGKAKNILSLVQTTKMMKMAGFSASACACVYLYLSISIYLSIYLSMYLSIDLYVMSSMNV